MSLKIWKDKEGNKLTAKDFLARFKSGIENLTPLQKISNESRGTFTTLLGYIVSLIAVIIMREKIGLLSYGLILIFIGSVWNTGLKWLSLRIQVKFLKDLENTKEEIKEVKEWLK